MREGLSKWFSASAGGGVLPTALALLARALCQAGKRAEALAAVAEALASTAQMGGSREEAELHRVKGELMLMNPRDDAEAERCYRNAMDIARAQSARLWELRATTSLARLLRRQGKTAEARSQLAEIYNWFTEGFEFADLKDAKALLDEVEA